jgi:MFS family permease
MTLASGARVSGPPGGLWRHPDFLRLWAGQTVSQVGSEVTVLALPLTAVLVLGAGPAAMGALAAAGSAPYLVFSLLAGVLVDRVPRRPVMIAANAGRAVLLALIPVSARLGLLGMGELYVVAFGVGMLTLAFEVAYYAYLPALVTREQLVDGNSRLEASSSAAQIIGPGLGGTLVQLVTAPIAIFVDALSFLASLASLLLIRTPEPPVDRRGGEASALGQMGEGLRFVFGHTVLRSIAACTGTYLLFVSAFLAVYLLYLTRELRLSPALIGVAFAAGAAGSLVGALLAAPVARRMGLGRAMLASIVVSAAGALLVPLATGPRPAVMAFLVAGQVVVFLSVQIYNVNQLSLRQAITPHRLQGRVNATVRFVAWGATPIGGLTGGLLGQAIGLRPTLLASAAGASLAFLWLFLSPVRRLREPPAPPDDAS